MGRGTSNAASGSPRRTTFGWEDMITVRLPKKAAEAFVDGDRQAELYQDAEEEILRQSRQQLAEKHLGPEFPDTWLTDEIHKRFDDPTTIALLEAVAEAVNRIKQSLASGNESYGITPEQQALVELYEEWMEKRPTRLVPPAELKSPEGEARRLRDAAAEYFRNGEAGKGRDCLEQALAQLIGNAEDGAQVMDLDRA